MKKKELCFILIVVVVIVVLLVIRARRQNATEDNVAGNGGSAVTTLTDDANSGLVDLNEQTGEVSTENAEQANEEDALPISGTKTSEDGNYKVIRAQKTEQNELTIIDFQIQNISGGALEEQNADIVAVNANGEEIASFTIVVPALSADETTTVGIPYSADSSEFSSFEIK